MNWIDNPDNYYDRQCYDVPNGHIDMIMLNAIDNPNRDFKHNQSLNCSPIRWFRFTIYGEIVTDWFYMKSKHKGKELLYEYCKGDVNITIEDYYDYINDFIYNQQNND